MGIIGYGNIGQAVAKIAVAMDMDVLVYTRTPKKMVDGCKAVSLDTLLRESDIITLHCPLTPESQHLINETTIAKMKDTALVINTSRGGVIDETALASALNEGRIAGAGVDVLSTEPPKADNPLLSAKNCVITPHIAWASKAARGRLLRIAADNVRCYLAGSVQNNVSQ
jgi:glycerate dehydrogenase